MLDFLQGMGKRDNKINELRVNILKKMLDFLQGMGKRDNKINELRG